MSEQNRTHCILINSQPENAEMAYYKTISFSQLGLEYAADTIYTDLSKPELAKKYLKKLNRCFQHSQNSQNQ